MSADPIADRSVHLWRHRRQLMQFRGIWLLAWMWTITAKSPGVRERIKGQIPPRGKVRSIFWEESLTSFVARWPLPLLLNIEWNRTSSCHRRKIILKNHYKKSQPQHVATNAMIAVLQLDVCDHNRRWRHPVTLTRYRGRHTGKQVSRMMLFTGKTVWSFGISHDTKRHNINPRYHYLYLYHTACGMKDVIAFWT